ncbi:DsrH/TusB family sulfur metabolism protein [Alteromonas sp. CI.11.F.A3]|uniref:DsrH/TusB family sulfur metabolism protein n=1 Tax=Alteromonas sp. CI.11.F.A3 TaxID=3079555 RepID=UPI002942763C|nr:DsrH/TusB family sulfur metabolism protein [Alteromonas sp. CI.11.F.A3]WOI35779.1 DsrH/TusB family sulfur metabolism protein [Alteromonas sp. CI.11.F.A3]
MLFIVKSYPLNALAIKTLKQAFRSAESDQALVLIDDGVYYAQQTNDGLLSVLAKLSLTNTIDANKDLNGATTSIFALQDDLALRGLSLSESHSVNQTLSHEVSSEDDTVSFTPISMDEFVSLTDTFYPIVYL